MNFPIRIALTLLLLLAACSLEGPPAPSAVSSNSPSPGVTPAPIDEKVALRVDSASDVVMPVGTGQLVVFDDGRVVRPSLPEGWSQVRLTPEGVGMLVAEATSTGLFEASSEHGPDGEVMFAGMTSVTIGEGAEAIKVTVIQPADGEAAQALLDLAHRLLAFEQWIPASAWLEEGAAPERFRPSGYLFTVGFEPNVDFGDALNRPAVDISELQLPFDAPLDELGEEVQPNKRCAVIDAAQVAAVRHALIAAGEPIGAPDTEWVSTWLGWETANGFITLEMFAVPPGEKVTCDRYKRGWVP